MIDAKISNGDLAAAPAGGWEMISGADAEFQRAMICVTARKGRFIYDRKLGTDAVNLSDAAKTELIFGEALVKYKNVRLRVNSVGQGVASVTLMIDGESRTQEVQSYGNV